MTRRVVITGLGTVNPLASDVKEFWRALCELAGLDGLAEDPRYDDMRKRKAREDERARRVR